MYDGGNIVCVHFSEAETEAQRRDYLCSLTPELVFFTTTLAGSKMRGRGSSKYRSALSGQLLMGRDQACPHPWENTKEGLRRFSGSE